MKFIILSYFLFYGIFLSNEIDNLEGVYKIKNFGEFLCLDMLPELSFINIKKSIKNLFRLKKANSGKNEEDNSYFIEEINSNKKLGLNTKTKDILLYDDKSIDEEDLDKLKWKFIRYNKKNIYDNKFYIQNKYNLLYLGAISVILKSTNQIKISCSFSKLESKNIFSLFKMFKEITSNDKALLNSKLLNDEQIDIVINYNNIHKNSTLDKRKEEDDEDNENNENNENLRYIIRSISQNIPWTRKIFILCINDNISILKEKEELKEKIIIIKIKDLLGFETELNSVVLFNLNQVKKFGLSNNFIFMNSNCFIGKPLNKSDFFWEEDGKIVPLLTSSKYNEIYYNEIHNDYKRLISKKNIINVDSPEGANYCKISSFQLLFNSGFSFNNKLLIAPENTLNAIPLNLNEINEIFEIIKKKYKFFNNALNSTEKNINSLEFYTLILSYMRNMKNRAVSIIPYKNYHIDEFNNENNFIFALFSINKLNNKKYSFQDYNTKKKKLKILFPKPSKYEIFYELEPNEKKIINDRLHNLINDIKRLGKLNYEYGKKRRSIYRKNHKMKRKINNLGRKSDEMVKLLPKIEKFLASLENNNLNKTKLINEINALESNVNKLKIGYNEIIDYNIEFSNMRKIIAFIIIIFVIFIVGFGYYKVFMNKSIIEYSDDFDENVGTIGIENNNFNHFNKVESETTKLKEIII